MTTTPTCIRKAWLTLGALTVPLENEAGGWFCPSLDLGYPEIRDVVSNRPDQDGVDDRTAYFGARTITAQITALTGAGAQIDAVAAQFAPFMLPAARPVLHYVLDRPGAPERTMTVRAAGYSWPIEGAFERDIQLQFVAADPAAADPVEKSATAWAGASTIQGRTYPLTFNRIYPAGGGGPTTGYLNIGGDLPVWPHLRIYGPITGPYVQIAPSTGPVPLWVSFLTSFTIAAGHYIDVSTDRRAAWADGDPTASVVASIDWYNSRWSSLPPNPLYFMTFRGSTTSGVTQAQATWHDRYIT